MLLYRFFFVFYSEKKSLSILIFDIFLVHFFSFVILFERKATSTVEQQKCKCHEKRDRLLISKAEVSCQISQQNTSFTQIELYLPKKCQV